MASNLMEEYLVLHETTDIFERDGSPVGSIFDEKLSNTLGYSETIFNHSRTVSERKALFDIIFNSKKLSSLDKAMIHELYFNILQAYKGNCGRTDKHMEKIYKTDIKDVMIDFVLSDDDIELLSKEVSWMRTKLNHSWPKGTVFIYKPILKNQNWLTKLF